MNFLSEALFDGTRIRVPTIIDAFTWLPPAIEVGTSYRDADVLATLQRVCRFHGKPKLIRVDNSPAFISVDLDLWAYLDGVQLDFSRPGKPIDNASVESFNGKFRAECMNQAWFPEPGGCTLDM